ncbi:polyphosphate kinase 2 family protein [Mucilaginibacter hurinus]|uniref:Polyphosphate kinase 2 family protein n=1 Tax=Mucilaginibacter hurinus TaxID=2201324 RepID=A0A367GPJ2_9SPHI|nr:polyphosphate kinase 2 family protein [Mucilaginibacter hurinus]RCH55394.1 polyphosphate kinase 2 family protein [Mucilaginibacter hurinus]
MRGVIDKLKVTSGKGFALKAHDTAYTADISKEDADAVLKDITGQIALLQDKLYSTNKYALLVIFQAMDAAGKDSTIKRTMSGLDPQGYQVFSFKQPSSEEYDHDFLWRHYKALPERGRIGIHNRSHYENVLVARVHTEYILNENLPGIDSLKKIDKKFWAHRYESIRAFEKHLHASGTVMIKFFLNVSRNEQKKRFLKRIEEPEKNWKFSSGDVKEREHWNDYMDAYETAIKETATDDCPWYVIPADKKWFSRIAVSAIILDTLKSLDLKYPVLPAEEKAELQNMASLLQNES